MQPIELISIKHTINYEGGWDDFIMKTEHLPSLDTTCYKNNFLHQNHTKVADSQVVGRNSEEVRRNKKRRDERKNELRRSSRNRRSR
jgi:hypothetical protein